MRKNRPPLGIHAGAGRLLLRPLALLSMLQRALLGRRPRRLRRLSLLESGALCGQGGLPVVLRGLQGLSRGGKLRLQLLHLVLQSGRQGKAEQKVQGRGKLSSMSGASRCGHS